VIRCRTYALAYLGKDVGQADAATTEETCRAEGPTMGEAQRLAAFGAAQKTQARRPPPQSGVVWID